MDSHMKRIPILPRSQASLLAHWLANIWRQKCPEWIKPTCAGSSTAGQARIVQKSPIQIRSDDCDVASLESGELCHLPHDAFKPATWEEGTAVVKVKQREDEMLHFFLVLFYECWQ